MELVATRDNLNVLNDGFAQSLLMNVMRMVSVPGFHASWASRLNTQRRRLHNNSRTALGMPSIERLPSLLAGHQTEVESWGGIDH